jgi:hypothetical protein
MLIRSLSVDDTRGDGLNNFLILVLNTLMTILSLVDRRYTAVAERSEGCEGYPLFSI